MSNDDDTKQIIKEFIELWQKQFSHIAKEPEAVASMLQSFQTMQSDFFNNINQENNVKPNTDTDLFSDANSELRKLKERIEYLEARIAKLES